MNIPELVALLNIDRGLERTTEAQYEQHAAVVDGLYTAFAGDYADHALDEAGHGRILDRWINYLGGIPSPAFADTALTSPDAIIMLKQDLAGENLAIQRYTERIEQAQSLRLHGLAYDLMGILAKENEHANDLETYLGIRKDL